MSNKSLTDQELIDRLDASLANDVLTDAYTPEEVAEAIREAGGDPEALGRRGADLAFRLLKERRLRWQQAARQTLAEEQSVASEAEITKLSRRELLEAIEGARSEPSLSGLVGAFHKRKPEQASDEELRNLLSDIQRLRRGIEQKEKRRASKKE